MAFGRSASISTRRILVNARPRVARAVSSLAAGATGQKSRASLGLLTLSLGASLGFYLASDNGTVFADARNGSAKVKVPSAADYAEIGAIKGAAVEKEYARQVPDQSALYVVDKTTNRPIPVEVSLEGKDFKLLGYGAKKVTFLQVAVYAFSIYAANNAVAGWHELAAASGEASDDVVRGLLRGDVAVRIQPVRDTTGAHLAGALNRHIQPTLPSPVPPEISAALSQFSALFPRSLPMDSELFLVKSGDRLSMVVNGKEVGHVDNATVSERVIWGYLKKDGPNVKDAREKLDEVVTWLAGRK